MLGIYRGVRGDFDWHTSWKNFCPALVGFPGRVPRHYFHSIGLLPSCLSVHTCDRVSVCMRVRRCAPARVRTYVYIIIYIYIYIYLHASVQKYITKPIPTPTRTPTRTIMYHVLGQDQSARRLALQSAKSRIGGTKVSFKNAFYVGVRAWAGGWALAE